MLFGVVTFFRLRLERVFQLRRNVNTLYMAALLLFQFSLALFASIATPLILRRFALPSSVENEIDLNLSFHTCSSDLHGICSFPSATVEYEKGTLFSPSIAYSLSVRLQFADIDQGHRLGYFQNILTFYDEERQLKTYTKTSYLREPSLFTKALWVFFFPLHLAGFFYDYNSLEILMTPSHFEASAYSSTKLVYQLQDRFAQVDRASLVIGAQFGIIRRLLYNWPFTTSFILFIVSFSVCCAAIVFYWGVKSFTGKPESLNDESASAALSSTSLNNVEPHNKSSAIHPPVPSDEYIPDNVDEVPSSVDISGIPFWDVRPLDPPQNDFHTANSNMRRRK